MIFSKSKRFPEVDKDYIPGPGEYEVILDDSSPYKRHGFISQTSRFSDTLDIPNATPNEFLLSHQQRYHHDYKNDSSTTTASSLSLSSTTSSIKSLFDDSAIRSLTTMSTSASNKKLDSPTSPDTPIVSSNQHERQKYAMQREIETLQAKMRKMELHIQSLENDKNDTKAIILTKELQLAELRSKNNTLHKTINRQEVSSKVAQLQKKIDFLEQQLQTTQQEYSINVDEKDSLKRQIDKFQRQQEAYLQKQISMEGNIHELTVKLAASKHDVEERDMQLNQLKNESQCMSETICSLQQRIQEHESDIHRLSNEKLILMQQVDQFKEEATQLNHAISLKDETINAFSCKVDEKENELREKSSLVEALEDRFHVYRSYIEKTVISYLKTKRREQEEHQVKEYNRVLTELYEAKKFINKQAQQLDGLKSNVHWLTVQNTQLTQIAKNIDFRTENHKKVIDTALQKKKQNTDRRATIVDHSDDDRDEVDSAISYSSKLTVVSNPEDNNSVFNDSGFGVFLPGEKQ